MRPVFTLVHGTWSPSAAWAEPNSLLTSRLRERFGSDTPIEPLKWGGWNNVRSRRWGTAKLRRRLRSASLQGDQRHFVIAHSHGGNVALCAMRDSRARERTAGIGTLATPFLVAGRRSYTKVLTSAKITLISALWLVLVGLGVVVADRAAAATQPLFGWLVLIGIAATVTLVLILITRAWDGFADRVVANMAFGHIARERLLVVRSPGDEASVILLSARGLLSLGLVLMRVMARACSGFGRLLKRSRKDLLFGWAFALVVLASWLALLWVAAQFWPAHPWMVLFVIATALWLLMPIFWNAVSEDNSELPLFTWYLLLGVILLAAVIAPSLLLVFYGWQLAVANLEVEVSAEATPPGEWSVVTLAGDADLGDDAVSALTHSRLYDDPRAIEIVGDWVQQLLDKEEIRAGNPSQRV